MEEIKSYKKELDAEENTSLKRIGNFIKEARLGRNQSIEELASNLKIGEHQLKAIEDGNEDQLPEKVFIKAMVRRISDKLNLDTKFIMDEFNIKRKEFEIKEIIEKESNKSQNNEDLKKNNPLNFGIFILISGIFGLLASSLIFNFLSESFQNQSPKQELIKKVK